MPFQKEVIFIDSNRIQAVKVDSSEFSLFHII